MRSYTRTDLGVLLISTGALLLTTVRVSRFDSFIRSQRRAWFLFLRFIWLMITLNRISLLFFSIASLRQMNGKWQTCRAETIGPVMIAFGFCCWKFDTIFFGNIELKYNRPTSPTILWWRLNVHVIKQKIKIINSQSLIRLVDLRTEIWRLKLIIPAFYSTTARHLNLLGFFPFQGIHSRNGWNWCAQQKTNQKRNLSNSATRGRIGIKNTKRPNSQRKIQIRAGSVCRAQREKQRLIRTNELRFAKEFKALRRCFFVFFILSFNYGTNSKRWEQILYFIY